MQLLWQLIENEAAKFSRPPLPKTTKHSKTRGKLDWVTPQLTSAILKLHKNFTSERESKGAADYFGRKDLLAAYLAYYLPLNFFKIKLLFESHAIPWDKNKTELHVFDFGCGPGTATLALLAFLHEKKKAPQKITLHLFDVNSPALDAAQRLVSVFAENLGLQISLNILTQLPQELPQIDILIAANVLNEMNSRDALSKLWQKVQGGFLLLEPSHRVSSQKLVRFREALIADSKNAGEAFHLLGPCLHSEDCPLYRTKHWCHFSEQVPRSFDEDETFKALNLKVFKNPRLWLKFSYLYFAKGAPSPSTKGKLYRAIGDLHPSGPEHLAIDLCQPQQKKALRISRRTPQHMQRNLVRGALIEVPSEGKIGKIKPFTSHRKA